MGYTDGTAPEMHLSAAFSANTNMVARINDRTASDVTLTGISKKGMFMATRTAAGARAVRRCAQAVAIQNATAASTGIPNAALNFLAAVGQTGESNRTLSAGFIGSGFSTAQANPFYFLLKRLMVSFGLEVDATSVTP